MAVSPTNALKSCHPERRIRIPMRIRSRRTLRFAVRQPSHTMTYSHHSTRRSESVHRGTVGDHTGFVPILTNESRREALQLCSDAVLHAGLQMVAAICSGLRMPAFTVPVARRRVDVGRSTQWYESIKPVSASSPHDKMFRFQERGGIDLIVQFA
jgi:hypothetical protein